jgi:hypothetical protein
MMMGETGAELDFPTPIGKMQPKVRKARWQCLPPEARQRLWGMDYEKPMRT